jgi:hypothetical protein
MTLQTINPILVKPYTSIQFRKVIETLSSRKYSRRKVILLCYQKLMKIHKDSRITWKTAHQATTRMEARKRFLFKQIIKTLTLIY